MKTKFVFLTPAFNCEIDDVSTDNTGKVVKDIASSLDLEQKIKVVRREEKHGETKNTIVELENIQDDEVIVRLDGGDWLTENDTLHFLDEVYRAHNPGVVWTKHRWAFTGRNISGPMNLYSGQTVYEHPWVSSHLKTFRANKLKRVPRDNFLDENGNWIVIACDQTVFLPMMHMCTLNNDPLLFIDHVCYHYSIDLEKPNLYHNQRSYNQRDMALWIRERGFLE